MEERHVYSREEILELQRSSLDVCHFMESYAKVKTVDGSEPRELNADQRRWLTQPDQMVLMGGKRQSRRTVTMAAYGLWKALFVPHTHVMYVAPTSNMTQYANQVIRQDYLPRIPGWMLPKLVYCSRTEVSFDNGSQIWFSPITEHCLRGRSLDVLLIDNIAHVRSFHVREEFMNCVYPSVVGNTGKILISDY